MTVPTGPYATASDVAARLGRALTDAETLQADALLADAETQIRARILNLDDRVTAGSPSLELVVMVEANAVTRYFRNPEGVRQQQAGPFSISIDSRAGSGFITILDGEWAMLGVVSRMGSMAPVTAANDPAGPYNGCWS